MNPSLEDLMVALQQGDRTCVEPVFEALNGPVFRFARSLLSGPEAEDAAQAALVRVFERVDEYDPDRGKVLSWALAITAWQCRSVAKTRRRQNVREDAEAKIDGCADGTPLVALMDKERAEAALSAIAGLSDADRAALLRSLDEGALDVRSRKRKQRALRRLRMALWPLLLWGAS